MPPMIRGINLIFTCPVSTIRNNLCHCLANPYSSLSLSSSFTYSGKAFHDPVSRGSSELLVHFTFSTSPKGKRYGPFPNTMTTEVLL